MRSSVAVLVGTQTSHLCFQTLKLESSQIIYRRVQKMTTFLEPYDPPSWVKELKFTPKFRVQLAQPNTPIHKWNIPGVPERFSIHIKRDDMTGGTLSGNKVRKLEFLLADAIDQGCKHVCTVGGIQSNHCRAVAVAARQLGLVPHLILCSSAKSASDIGCDGNVLLNRMCGADMYVVPRASPYLPELRPRQERLAQIIKQQTGESTYLIPVGGSNKVGLFGYISAFQELQAQGALEKFDDLVFTCGSGGTAAGLSIANYLTGNSLRCHGFLVCDDDVYFYDHIQQTLEEVGLPHVNARDIVDIVPGYKGKGYSISTEEELDFITNVSIKSGIMLDPTYTGKAAYGMVQELTANPQRFSGDRLLFLHTGGVFGLFDGRMDGVLKKTDSETESIKMWLNKTSDPS
ncbi:bifunctional D-cysteine desulfhydrase/1-aminocyclopropane-1-carboxylate deaminase, mitochondrial-like [Haliotis rufescens]|uniref:bifunctional D-cysteine desulfhydrase/1-aminocyclopropane-1-carboxylate deaminase, mitochondrial-like n=1 Tax=Haliotis rufescens TaxID=6454 RepID=UPI00201F924C|nr:bifunctional D-cysteine desulfhydrase/1-aminocyclopropane-1-carboxylate deaminase, mitochondrial-like [Haliotis rufescens]